MSQFPIHTIDDAPETSRPWLEAAKEKFGFVPNLLGELAAAPAALQAYLTLGELLSQSSLSAVEQQVVLLAASVANKCEYCVAAHSAGLRQAGLDSAQIEAVRKGRPLADPSVEAVRAFTTAVVDTRGWPGESALKRFLAAGHTPTQALEILLGVAMKTLSNYTNHLAATPLDRPLEPFAWRPAAA